MSHFSCDVIITTVGVGSLPARAILAYGENVGMGMALNLGYVSMLMFGLTIICVIICSENHFVVEENGLIIILSIITA